LTDKPFSLTPNPDFLYFSAKHRVAYSMLEYGLLEQNGITVITGDIGAGKTTLLRHLIDKYQDDTLQIGIVNNMFEGYGHLMQWVSMAFNIEYENDNKVALLQKFQKFTIDNYAEGKTTVVVVDEAQNLSETSLEELRLLNNINSCSDDLLKIILIGQPELLDRLRQPSLIQLAQRVSVEYHLEALDVGETVAYIQHRMKVVGGDASVFDDSALYAIYYLSHGIPRLINTLADYALVYAYSSDSKEIGVETIVEVAKGRRIGGLNHQSLEGKSLESVHEFVELTTGVRMSEQIN
jgi:type II secretory pathway predicted ATPase ExeA